MTENEEKKLCAEALIISGVKLEKCMKCGKCSGACPSYDEMEYHPHQFVDMVSRGQIKKLMESASIYKCLSCFVCVERCPRNVMPANIIEAVRALQERPQGTDRLTPDEVKNILDDDTPQQLLMAAFRKYSR